MSKCSLHPWIEGLLAASLIWCWNTRLLGNEITAHLPHRRRPQELHVLAGSPGWDTIGSAPCFGTLIYVRMLLGAKEGGVQVSPPLEATMGCVSPDLTQAVRGAGWCLSMSAEWGMPDPPAVSRFVSPARLWIWFGCREIYKAFS